MRSQPLDEFEKKGGEKMFIWILGRGHGYGPPVNMRCGWDTGILPVETKSEGKAE